MKLILLRGLSGTGKSTFAKNLPGFKVTCSDDYFIDEKGEYVFNPEFLPRAHEECLLQTRLFLLGEYDVIVTNTFSRRWEMQPYLDLAKELRASGFEVILTVLDLFDAGLTDEQLAEWNAHGVPVHTIANMRANWEHDWKNGSPIR